MTTKTSSGGTAEQPATSVSTSVSRRAGTTAAPGSCPELRLMKVTAWLIRLRNDSGESPSSGATGAGAASCPLRTQATTLRFLSRPANDDQRRSSAAGDLALAGPLEVGLGPLDLALEGGHGLPHRLDGLGPERVQRVHRREDVVERRLQLGDVDGRRRGLLVDGAALDAQLLGGRLDEVGGDGVECGDL